MARTIAAALLALSSAAAVGEAQVAVTVERDAAPSDEDVQRSAALFEQAEAAYNAGELTRAVELLDEAYALYAEPVLLYNLARAHEALGNVERARESYEAYLEAVPDTPDRGAIERRLDTLRAQLEVAAAARRPSPPPLPPPALDPPSDRAAPWIVSSAIVSGAAFATLGVGVALGILTEVRLGDAVGAPDHRGAARALEEARDLALAANVLFVAVGALAAVALTGWIVVGVVASDGERAEVAVGVEPGGLALRLRWR